MEKVLCTVHGLPCFLKTGIRDGPSKGKSFYVCGVQNQPPCGFVLPSQLSPSHCLVHEEHIVELQVLVQQKQANEYRLLYRCSKAKREGKKWCGDVPWQDLKTTRSSTKPQTQHMPDVLLNYRGQRNPFKVPSKNYEPVSAKEMNECGRKDSVRKEEEKKGVAASDEKNPQKLSSEYIRKELPIGLKIQKKQFGDKERIEPTAKSSEPATGRNGLVPLNTQICGSRKKFEEHFECVRLDSTVRSTEPSLKKAEKPKQLLPSVSNQVSGMPLHDEQQKGESETCGRKPETVTGFLRMPPKEKPAVQSMLLPPGIVPVERSCTGKNASRDGQGTNRPCKMPVELVADFQKEKDCKQNNLPAISREATSYQKSQTVDSKALHSQLSAQLRDKKNTLKLVNVQALPDKGERLLKQVEELETALSSLNLETEENAKEEGDVNVITGEGLQHNSFSRTATEPPRAVKWKGPQPLQQHHVSSSLDLYQPLGSRQYSSSTNGEDSHMQTLYGGRMTDDRLNAVYIAISDAINQLHKSLESCPTEEVVAEDPPGLKVSLLRHQKQALAWLLWRENQKPCGGILADDMGLGKTLTMIALVLAQKQILQKEKEKKLELWLSKKDSAVVLSHGTLIVCPASLIHHWKKEVERHVRSGKLKVSLYHGSNRNRNTTALSDYDMVVTTYSILAKEISTEKEKAEAAAEDSGAQDKSLPFSPLLWIHWARIILDEAHNIKNPKVQASLAACKLRANARWAVTGTPIQNNLLDMYSLLRFLRCSPFDEFKVWKNQVDNQTRKGGERLVILTRSLLLRRTKNQLDSSGKPLVSLPQRLCKLHKLKLSDDEQSVYDVLFTQSRSSLQSYLKRQEAQSTGATVGNSFDKVAQQFRVGQLDPLEKAARDIPSVSTTIHILSLLLRLRQCCCHLSLLKVALDQANLDSEGISLSLEEQLNALTLSESESSDAQSIVYLLGTAFKVDLFEATRQSTKLAHLLEELKIIQGHSQKSVIVSQWTSMLKVVAVHLEKLGLKYATVDGSVNPKQRMDVVEEFNNTPQGPQVMLISLLAGGVGLNLVGGNHLFLLDMHWNPALEDQACDRIYRVGQRNDVMIHRFVCEGTVEEKITELQTRKKELAQKVLSGRAESFTKLTLADLKLLFGI